MKEYETTHKQTFTIYGTSLENVLAETWESINHERETMKKARKEAKDKVSFKLFEENAGCIPSQHRGPTPLSKRKLFTPSPNTSLARKNKNDKKKPTVSASKIRRSGRIPFPFCPPSEDLCVLSLFRKHTGPLKANRRGKNRYRPSTVLWILHIINFRVI